MQKIIRALVLVYALCAPDSATPQAGPLAAGGGPQALMVSHRAAATSLSTNPPCRPQETSS